MAKSTGKRPAPRVANPGSNTWRTSSGKYDGVNNPAKSTGSRPVPKVARNTPPTPTKPGAVKRPIKHTSMPAKSTSNSESRGRQYGTGIPVE